MREGIHAALLKGIMGCLIICASGVLADRAVSPYSACQTNTDLEVTFAPLSEVAFIEDEMKSAAETFHIDLECGFPVGSLVSVMFSGEKDLIEPSLFEVSGTAMGIALAMEDPAGNAILPDGEPQPLTLSKRNTILTWRVRVQSTSGQNVDEGEFNSVVTFTLLYE